MKEQYKLVPITDMTLQPRRVETGDRVEVRAVLGLIPCENSPQGLNGSAQDLEDSLYGNKFGLIRAKMIRACAPAGGIQDRFGVIRGKFAHDEAGYFLDIHSFEDRHHELDGIAEILEKGGV